MTIQGHSDPTFSNLFFLSETAMPIEANFIRNLHGIWGMKMCSNVPGHMAMPSYGKKKKKSSSSE